MSLQFHSNHDEGLTTINGDGVANWDSLLSVLQALLASSSNQVDLPHVIDLRNVELDLASGTMVPFGEFFALRFASDVKGSIAIVVSDSLNPEDCAKLYRVASSAANAELFDDYNHAMRWLMKREFAHHDPATDDSVSSAL